MIKKRFCKNCGTNIDHLHGNAIRCETCAMKYKILYHRKFTKKRDKSIPPSARGEYRYYWKFLVSLSLEELSALYHTKQLKLKVIWGKERRPISTQIKLISEAYKRKAPMNYKEIEEVNPNDKCTEEVE